VYAYAPVQHIEALGNLTIIAAVQKPSGGRWLPETPIVEEAWTRPQIASHLDMPGKLSRALTLKNYLSTNITEIV